MSAISTWSTTAASNNSAAPNGWPEGMAPSAVNDTARETHAAIRTWYEDAEWINFGHTIAYSSATIFTAVSSTTDLTGKYHVGRRVRAVGSTTGTIYGTINTASFSSPTNTITVTWDSGSLSNESLAISLHIVSSANSQLNAPTGMLLLFPGISAAPKGWTIDTTAAYDKAAIRVRSSASTTTGGSVDFETAFATGSTGSYTLLTADIPSHAHTATGLTITDAGTGTSAFSAGTAANAGGAAVLSASSVSNSTSHNFSVGGSVANTGGGGGHSHSLALAVKYLDACVCVKI